MKMLVRIVEAVVNNLEAQKIEIKHSSLYYGGKTNAGKFSTVDK
jgi:hypothetical protein